MDSSSLTLLVSELSALAATYVPPTGHDAASQAPKAALVNLTRKITHSLMDPAMMVQAHSLQMAEMVSVRTLLDLKVFEKMPTDESERITAKELSEQSGVQQALLGKKYIHCTIEDMLSPTQGSLAPAGLLERSLQLTRS